MGAEFDAILLLGLRTDPDGAIREELTDRAKRASELFSSGAAPVIVACGGFTGGEMSEAEALSNALFRFGVDAAHVILENESRNTFENFQNAAQIIGSGKSVAVVTGDYHAFRAYLAARRAGFRARVYAVHTPRGRIKHIRRALELLAAADLVLGWEDPGRNRPAWAGKLMTRILERSNAKNYH